MRQIAEWLAKIGLERYARGFIDNDIDVQVHKVTKTLVNDIPTIDSSHFRTSLMA
jgi:hypothetical protein